VQRKPVSRDTAYLKYIRSLGCTCCDATNWIDAHHVGTKVMSRKASDYETIPLCRAHHDECHQLGAKRFALKHSLNIPELLARLQEKPTLKRDEGQYVAYIGNKEYMVGSVGMGLEAAVLRVKQLWWEDRAA
jgi:hypothetical protein